MGKEESYDTLAGWLGGGYKAPIGAGRGVGQIPFLGGTGRSGRVAQDGRGQGHDKGLIILVLARGFEFSLLEGALKSNHKEH